MSSVTQEEALKKDFYVVRNSSSGEVISVVFPNGIQVGLSTGNFNKGIVLPNLSSAPKNTKNALYAINGDIYFNGVLVAPSAGSNLTIKDEGTTLTSTASSINFTGSGITATASGNDVTVTTEADAETQILASQVFG